MIIEMKNDTIDVVSSIGGRNPLILVKIFDIRYCKTTGIILWL